MLILRINLLLTMKEILRLAVYGIATIAALASCSKEPVPSQNDIKAGILGTWKQFIVDDEYCLTNLRSTKTFFADGKETVSNSKYSESKGGWMWRNKELYNYTIKGNLIYENSTVSSVAFTTTVLKIEDNKIEYFKTNDTEGFIGDRHSDGVLVKVDADYSLDIIGLWEGVEMTGQETYGDANHRIQYRADGTYEYLNKVDGKWVKSDNEDNEYNVHGDWLATRWRPEAGADFNYEWWDIDYIKDGVMKWSALRETEDGERFVATFTWKKVATSIDGITRKTFPEGALPGKFSVSDTKQVYISQGNLQFHTTDKVWRFAENQYDICDSTVSHITTDYYENSGKWIDHFGWGTSGYDNGFYCYQPWYSDPSGKYCQAGNLAEGDGKSDWGYNAIINGGNKENIGWRTLTKQEWEYLLGYGTNHARLRMFRYGIKVLGLYDCIVLYPDEYSGPHCTNGDFRSYETEDAYNEAVAAGAVFLPIDGQRVSNFMHDFGGAFYWSSTAASDSEAYVMIGGDGAGLGKRDKSFGHNVRLVIDVPAE